MAGAVDLAAVLEQCATGGAAISGIFKPPSDGYVEVPLLEEEKVVRRQTASYLVNGKAMWGGQLVLTSQRLLFRPLDTSGIAGLLKEGVNFLPNNLAVLGKVVNRVLDYSTAYGANKAGAIHTAQITAVRAGGIRCLARRRWC